MSLNLLSLFCGAGGLDLGFTRQGFNVSLAIDFSQAAIDTHKANFAFSKAQNHDLLKLGIPGLLDLCKSTFKNNESIGIIGGPPCQGFSRGNIGASKDDPRNQLALFYIKAIEALKENLNINFIVFENVLGIRDKKHQDIYNEIIFSLKQMNFEVFENELNAADFGVPQIRKRVIIIALKKPQFSSPPSFTSMTVYKTVKDAIYGLPDPIYFKRGISPNEIPHHPNHWTMKPKSNKFQDIASFDNKNRSFRAINWDKPSPTVAYGNREIHVHPDKKRRLSIYESLLLQGFPKDFVLCGTLSQQVTQVSNAVPPPMAAGIAKEIKRILRSTS